MTGPRPAERRWTLGEEKQLLEMLKAGKTAVEISREINRAPGAIYSRVQRVHRRRRSPSNATSWPERP